MQSLQPIWTGVRDALFWAPDWLNGLAVLVLAAALALLLHQLIFALLKRVADRGHPYARAFLERAKGLTGFALVAVALAVAAGSAPFNERVTFALSHLLLLAFIALAGWIAHVAVDSASRLYLRRFSLESADTLLARKHTTQVHILTRAAHTLIVVLTASAALMTFDAVRQYGLSLFASAGIAGIIAGLAARPVLSNLFAGIQIATTQPIRIGDQVIVEGESGSIEEITSTYVVVRLWDLRRLIVPLSHFIEKPFQNWTREATNLIGAVFLYVDYTVPVERIRAKLLEIVEASPLWDGNTVKLHVTEARESSIQLRALASARSAGDSFELQCEIREKLVAFVQQEFPFALPRQRQANVTGEQVNATRQVKPPGAAA